MVRYGRFTKINISKCEHFTREINCINLHLVVWFFFLVLIVSVVVFGVLCCFKLALLSLLFLLYDNGRNRSMHRQRYLQKAKGFCCCSRCFEQILEDREYFLLQMKCMM